VPNAAPSFKSSHAAFATLFLLACSFSYAIPLLPPEYTGLNYILLQLMLTCLMIWAWMRGDLSINNILIIGLLARLLLIPIHSFTSNDSERYLWDGAVLLAGLDPYNTTPDMAVSQELRSIWPTPEEHSQYPTIYPPGALFLFAISALGGPVYGFFIWKIILTSSSILALFFMKDLTTKIGAARHFPLFSLAPLLIMEIGIGAHLDGVMILLIVLCLWFLKKQHFIKAGITIGLGASVKFIPILILGPLLFAVGIRKTMLTLIGATATLILIYGTIYFLGSTPIGAVTVFFEKWRGGSPLFAFLEPKLSTSMLWLILLLIAVTLFFIAAIFAKRKNFLLSILLTFSVPMIISPIIFPWYLLSLTPLFALAPTLTLFLWLTTTPFGYEVLNLWVSDGIWHQASWPLWVTAILLPIGVMIDVTRRQPKKIDFFT